MTVRVVSGGVNVVTVKQSSQDSPRVVTAGQSTATIQTGTREAVTIQPIEGPGLLRVERKQPDSVTISTAGSYGGGTFDSNYVAVRDSSNQDILYKAKPAVTGADFSDPVWQVSRKVMSTGVVTYADGDQLFDNDFSNRENLSYS